MANILCMTTGLTGILNASFELASRLESMGHTVTCASPIEVKEKVQAQGFKYLQLSSVNYEPAPAIPAYSGALKKVKRLAHKLIHVRKRRRLAVSALGMGAFLDQMKTLKPALVIVDIELHEHIMTLFTAKFKVLLLSQWFSTWDGKGLPPIQSDIIPGSGYAGSDQGMQRSWRKVSRSRWKMFLKKKLNTVYTDRRSILQKYAKEVGFPKELIRKNYWPGPFSYDKIPVISMTAEGLEFNHTKREGLTYVGPMVHADRKESSSSKELTQELQAIFSEKQTSNKRLIYCSVSTFSQGDTEFLKRVIEAIKSLSNCLLIISLGGKIDPKTFGKLPDNIFVFSRVPQLEVLRQADLSINHGGIHTINECLHFRVPMLVYSGKRSDQNGCAARVHHHGVGLMADKDEDQPEDIKRKISEMLYAEDTLVRIQEILAPYASKTTPLEEALKASGILSTFKKGVE